MINSEDRERIADELLNLSRSIRGSKGKEYSGNTDVLANFKRTADNIGLTVPQVIITFAQKHWDSIVSAVKSNPSRPEDGTEPFNSRLADLINYVILLECSRREARTIKHIVAEIEARLDSDNLGGIQYEHVD